MCIRDRLTCNLGRTAIAAVLYNPIHNNKIIIINAKEKKKIIRYNPAQNVRQRRDCSYKPVIDRPLQGEI